ncbi:hypothetical protein niasHS_010368 [Heterodera schachtii]|uniref:Secreted protein n=1 Tax=Heterodera schachtii TaxID=97005 RepID=A0ABD2IZK5_HETSC
MLFLPPLPAGWSFFAFARTHGRPEEPADRRDTSGTPPPHISGCECVIVVVAVVGAAWPAADQRNLIVVFWWVGQGSVRPSAPPSAGPIKAAEEEAGQKAEHRRQRNNKNNNEEKELEQDKKHQPKQQKNGRSFRLHLYLRVVPFLIHLPDGLCACGVARLLLRAILRRRPSDAFSTAADASPDYGHRNGAATTVAATTTASSCCASMRSNTACGSTAYAFWCACV